jgi:hypothetical protein
MMVCASGAQAASSGLSVELRSGEAKDAAAAGTVKLYGASHALVIGNDAYGGAWPRLSNAIKDARLITRALRAKGFKVTLKTDLNSRDLIEAFEAFFYETGQDPDARLFVWYAGHGYSERSEGYLVPIDAPDPSETGAFLRKALSLRRMGEYMRGANALHVLSVFDSCFAGTVFNVGRAKPPPAITRATTRPVRQFLTSGDAGQEVSDDGTFRKLFIRAITGESRADANNDGYLAASELGLFITNEITNYSNGAQTPRNGKLNDPDLNQGDFVFQVTAPTPAPATSTAPVATAQNVAAAPKRSVDKEVLFWQSIQDSDSASDYEAYLAQHPDGAFSHLARSRAKDLKTRKTAALTASATPTTPKCPPSYSDPDGGAFTWNGACANGMASGAGIQTYASGSTFKGNLTNNRRNGHGVFVWGAGTARAGDRYEGDFRDGERHGRGVLRWTSGATYDGEFRDNEFHGRGIMKWVTGARYEGEWRNGERHGRGVKTDANGVRRGGEWRNGAPVGQLDDLPNNILQLGVGILNIIPTVTGAPPPDSDETSLPSEQEEPAQEDQPNPLNALKSLFGN